MTRILMWILSLIPHTVIMRAPGQPYLTRYYLLGRRTGWRKNIPFNLFLHCFHSSDEPIPHNHPFSGRSLILKGSYSETRVLWPDLPVIKDYHPGSVNVLHSWTFHYLTLLTPRVWTLFLAGRRVQDWGFQTSKGFVTWREQKSRRLGATWTGGES